MKFYIIVFLIFLIFGSVTDVMAEHEWIPTPKRNNRHKPTLQKPSRKRRKRARYQGKYLQQT